MEQRPPRLGDTVDDYCPRERRVTDHAVVAIVEDAIRLTRCTACNTEHAFKGGHEPRRRLKPALVPANGLRPATVAQLVVDAEHTREFESVAPAAVGTPVSPPPIAAPDEGPEPGQARMAEPLLAHRRLIRASLPKVEGELPPPRPIPEFTMHQRPPQGRPGRPHRFDHAARSANGGGFFRGRPTQYAGLPHDDEDEVNGNVAGPPQARGGPNGSGGASGSSGQQPGGAGSGRRRRGRRRRGRGAN